MEISPKLGIKTTLKHPHYIIFSENLSIIYILH